ncbi:hypothetical protein HXX76_008771 [Chlamydomonas incerta]|uniref:NAD(+) kinase n=1 Tax=Chlamydomonas incerta TaxID=51695 RepID=A0A835STQ9_CHLIN|nr:hypothetical protein HXX76_008771 [Chlamydomonas incerta]|eukprot:KAG2433044.1 hypothetical protein HXX76_008771 [Chlamydomonas incerta]
MAGLGPLDVARRTRVLAGHLAASPAGVAATPSAAPTPALTPASSKRQLSSTSRPSAASLNQADTDGFEAGIIRGASVKYNDSAALRLRRRALLQWQPGSPSKVLIVKKPKNPAAAAKLKEIGDWLTARGIQVYVERVVWATEFKEFSVFDPRYNQEEIDFCITLGGDGTVLYMTSLFEEDQPLPPVLCFAMGSLGFLTPFDASTFAPTLERVLDTTSQPLFCTLRTRKRCEVVHEGQLVEVHHVLNECVLDRGAFPGAVLLEIFIDGSYVTNVEADGLIISTPSGSTAYSMSAGGPVVAPSVPCTVLTPIAPLSLSFRPVVIPENSSICVHLPTCVRSHARASFDGKRTMRVRRGTSIFFTTSLCPLPVISLGRMDTDWYEGITSKLKWNQAIRQLPSCPSPVGAKQQELCSARHADRTSSAAAAITAAMDGCPIGSDAEEVALPASAATPVSMAGQAAVTAARAAAAKQERESEREWLGPAGGSRYGTSSGDFTDWGAGGSDGGGSSGHASDDSDEAPEVTQPPPQKPSAAATAAAAAAAVPSAPVPVAPRRPGGANGTRRYSAAAAGGGGGLSSFQKHSSVATKAGGMGSVPGQEESVLVREGSISDSLTDAEEDMAASLSAAGASGASVDTIYSSASAATPTAAQAAAAAAAGPLPPAAAGAAAAAAAAGGRSRLRLPRAPAAGGKDAAPAADPLASPGRPRAPGNGGQQKPRRS